MPSKIEIDWSPQFPIDPHELYLMSLRLGKKLPDQLHNHMLLWSFDDRHSHLVKDYLEWIEHCRDRDLRQAITRKRLQDIEKMDRVLGFMAILVVIVFSVALTISGKIR